MIRTEVLAGWRRPSLTVVVYALVAGIFFMRGLLAHPGYFIGRGTDPAMFMWYLRWWRFVLEHRINPFLTDLLWAPLGFNLAWTTFIPLPAWLVIPIGRVCGETAAYNALCFLAIPLAAISAFLLCRRITGTFWPSLLGGYIFGFSPYMLGNLLAGHLHLMLAFPIPLAALTGLRRLDGEITARRFTIEFAILLVVQFLCGIELFATMTIFGGFVLLAAIAFFDGETRARLFDLAGPLVAAYAITMLVVSPYLYYLFAFGFPKEPIWSPDQFTGDLLNFFIPTDTNLLGTLGFARVITGTFNSNIYENCAYLGIPLLVTLEVYRRTAWRISTTRFLIAILGIAVVASFGSVLRVAGRAVFPMPWRLFAMLPVISNALPIRFMMYAFLVLSVMVAMWFATSAARPVTKLLAAALILVSIAPNPHASFWVSPLDIPAFFTDRTYASELEPSETILALPWGHKGNSMYWQLRSDMYFRMAGGWTGIMPFEFLRMPVLNYFYGGIDLPEAADQLKAFIARFGVRAVIADPTDVDFPIWQQTLVSLGVPAINEKGVWLYKIPPDSFPTYAKLSGAQLEARANALQFDIILEAAGAYLAKGYDLSKLSPAELRRLDLLPREWLVASDDSIDWQIGPAPGGGVAIIIVGSYEGVKPLIERYGAVASEIGYPMPKRWAPHSRPRLDLIKPLLMVFDSTHLAGAAQTLRDSPPPERTTPFVAGVLAGL